jgi:hypothetical protein
MNAQLETQMAELRGMFVLNTEKLGHAAARLGVRADLPLREFMAAVEAAVMRK